ncbi:hypothetical protein HA402_009239 [Bradysia odoriphaga]|nr:hypothetical protein HA402_009239 [Bradysia odoriphaga]
MEELAIVYVNEDETKGLIETSDSSKCGEVFRSISGRYTLRCSHCSHSFLCLTEFTQHIEEHFQLISITSSSEFNSVLVLDDFKDEMPDSVNVKEEPSFRISEVKVESDSDQIKRRSNRKRPSHPVDDSDIVPKSTKPKVNKISKVPREPATTNMWICDICGKILSTKNHIYQHMKLHRNAPKEHKCYLCGWEFYEKGNLTRHLRTHNNDPKAFKCELCNKGFAQERYLSDHKKIHFPDASFLCATCGKSFTSSSLLMRHTIVHTGEKKYSCDVCSRAFSRSDKLKEHKNVHTGLKPFHCSWEGCNKSFSAKKSLRFHEYAHSGTKKFKCNYCDLLFINPVARRSHEKSGHLVC